MDFKKLSSREYELLLKFPIYISLLAANTDGEMDAAESLASIEFAHVKTYSCDPLLVDFFRLVNEGFERNLHERNKALPPGKQSREIAIKHELLIIENIVSKLGAEDKAVIHNSMKSFKEHISRAHHNVLIDFLFPMPIKRLSY